MKSKNNYINEAIKNPRYGIFYKGKLIKKYPFYKDAANFCILHNHGKDSLPFPEIEDICELVDLSTGETLNNLFSRNSSQ